MENVDTTNTHLVYRRDIDGLRAIAVGAVVLFHAKLFGAHGGYIGVDVFFVISGFLITSILRQDQERGRISIARFYERRIRRIMPALLACLVLVTMVCAATLLPGDFAAYGRSLVATILFSSNFYFWRTGGYFGGDADTKPLLHTWSLSVEEQFYLFFPILLMLTSRFGLGWQRRIVAILALISFALSVGGISLNKLLPTFFLFPPRAWEMLVGSALALGMHPTIRPPLVKACVSGLGLALILASVFAYDRTTPFPGLTALPPVLGTALVILAGIHGPAPFSPILGSKPLVAVGLISYSLYLWHWPVLVLSRYLAVRDLSTLEAMLAVLASAGLAYLSWRFVEAPFRSRQMSFRRAGSVAAVMSGGLVLIGLGVAAMAGLPGRFSPAVAELNRSSGTMYQCQLTDYMPFGRYYACPVNLQNRRIQEANVVVWGDSHAQMYVPAIEIALREQGLHGILVPLNGCAPLADRGTRTTCKSINAANYDNIRALNARVVILAMNWEMYSGREFFLDGGSVTDKDFGTLLEGVVNTARGLHAAGKRVVIVGPVPTPKYDLPSVVSRSVAYRRNMSEPTMEMRAQFEGRLNHVLTALSALEREGTASIIYPHRRVCGPKECDYIQGGRPIFADASHLTRDYARDFQPEFRNALENDAGPKVMLGSGQHLQ